MYLKDNSFNNYLFSTRPLGLDLFQHHRDTFHFLGNHPILNTFYNEGIIKDFVSIDQYRKPLWLKWKNSFEPYSRFFSAGRWRFWFFIEAAGTISSITYSEHFLSLSYLLCFNCSIVRPIGDSLLLLATFSPSPSGPDHVIIKILHLPPSWKTRLHLVDNTEFDLLSLSLQSILNISFVLNYFHLDKETTSMQLYDT